MVWNVYFFQTSRGEKIVNDFCQKLQDKTRGKISQNLDLFKVHGPFLGMPRSKRLVKEIYELRIRGKEEVRILYTFSRNSIYLLHAFKKQTQKTPRKEIDIAESRKLTLDRI